MKIRAINGSPRKGHNTATVLQHALNGAAQAMGSDADVQLIHLRDIKFSTCISCFECRKKGSKHYGHCALNDGLSPVLADLADADGIIFGSPIYFGNISGLMSLFLERLLFPYYTYSANYETIAPKKMPTAFIYTMNVTESAMRLSHYPEQCVMRENTIGNVFTRPDVLYVNNTYQFDDYSRYVSEGFSEPEKRAYRETQFPEDCRKAFLMGQNMAQSLA